MAASPTVRVLQVLDLVVYGVGLAVLVGGSSAGAMLLASGSVTRAREAVFLVGMMLLFVGVILSRPQREELYEDDGEDDEGEEPVAVQQGLARVVPDQPPLPPADQPSTGAKLLVAGIILEAAVFAPGALA